MRIAGGWIGLALAAGVAGAGLAQEAEPQRFEMMAHPEGGIWVLDVVEGQVSRCIDGGAGVPRVVGVNFGTAIARPRDGAGRQPICTDWQVVEAPKTIRPRVVGVGDGASGFGD
jgi:hypothetical protein